MACAANPAQPQTLEEKLAEKGYQMGEQVRRIQNYRLNGWSYVDRKHVIMNAGVSDHYLVSLRSPCIDLQSAIDIGFTTTIGSLTKNDKLIVRAPGNFNDTCMIDSLQALKKIEKTDASE